jgi:DNA invertase Pin-like site-specific DNA recombinase
MAQIGYTRVSTTDQNTDRQELGDIRIFEDKASGKNTDRPALKEMLAYIREGDEVVVYSIDRLARNLRDLEDIITEINSKGASVTFITERLTFSGSDDAMSTRKRQAEGIALAKSGPDAKLKYAGRKQSIDRDVVVNMLSAGSSVTAIAKALTISRQSIYRIKAEVGM